MHTPLPDAAKAERQTAELRRRRQLALAMLAALLVIVAAFAVHWYQRMQYREVAQGAVVEGRLLQLAAPVAGKVLAIGAEAGQRVKPGQALLELKGQLGQAVASSPVAGVVTQHLVKVGQQVAAGAGLMAILPYSDMWVTARFKPSQLHKLASGQPVTLTTSSYGRGVHFHGTVMDWPEPASQSGQPGQAMQRQPVRISLDANEMVAHPLQPGLRMRVSVDTRG